MTQVASRPIMENNQALQMALELSMLNLNSTTNNLGVSDSPNAYSLFDDDGTTRMPRSQNITQCVAVPSSEHVAEIVGRQGKVVCVCVCVCVSGFFTYFGGMSERARRLHLSKCVEIFWIVG